jgi:hypothetical protein
MAPKASVLEASPLPPPLPPGPLPTASGSSAGPSEVQPVDVPIASLGEDEEEEDDEEEDQAAVGAGSSKEDGSDDEEWDPSEERLPGQSSKDKGKGKATEQDASQPWQAVWAAEQNGNPSSLRARDS